MHWVNNLIEMNERTEQSEGKDAGKEEEGRGSNLGVKPKIPVRSHPHARSYLSDRLSHLQYFFFLSPFHSQ